jgi:hypothetical protein
LSLIFETKDKAKYVSCTWQRQLLNYYPGGRS